MNPFEQQRSYGPGSVMPSDMMGGPPRPPGEMRVSRGGGVVRFPQDRGRPNGPQPGRGDLGGNFNQPRMEMMRAFEHEDRPMPPRYIDPEGPVGSAPPKGYRTPHGDGYASTNQGSGDFANDYQKGLWENPAESLRELNAGPRTGGNVPGHPNAGMRHPGSSPSVFGGMPEGAGGRIHPQGMLRSGPPAGSPHERNMDPSKSPLAGGKIPYAGPRNPQGNSVRVPQPQQSPVAVRPRVAGTTYRPHGGSKVQTNLAAGSNSKSTPTKGVPASKGTPVEASKRSKDQASITVDGSKEITETPSKKACLTAEPSQKASDSSEKAPPAETALITQLVSMLKGLTKDPNAASALLSQLQVPEVSPEKQPGAAADPPTDKVEEPETRPPTTTPAVSASAEESPDVDAAVLESVRKVPTPQPALEVKKPVRAAAKVAPTAPSVPVETALEVTVKFLQGISENSGEGKFLGRAKLYISHLPQEIALEELVDLFTPYGEVGDAFLAGDKKFGIIKMDYRLNAELARMSLHKSHFKGNTLSVRYAAQANSVKISGLGSLVTNEILRDAMSTFGDVERAVVSCDERGKSKGYGIVEFQNKKAASTSIESINNGFFIIGRLPKVVTAKSLEYEDAELGVSEEDVRRYHGYAKEKMFTSRFAQQGTIEQDFAKRWKELSQMEEQELAAVENKFNDAKATLETEMQDVIRRHEENMVAMRTTMFAPAPPSFNNYGISLKHGSSPLNESQQMKRGGQARSYITEWKPRQGDPGRQ